MLRAGCCGTRAAGAGAPCTAAPGRLDGADAEFHAVLRPGAASTKLLPAGAASRRVRGAARVTGGHHAVG